MRLHRLEITAFGPFAGTQRVDFDELSAAGLFLLHGPTGAGKTSVLDAVCYALYGQVPGVRPATRLRSDHAAPGTATEVVLELTAGGRRLEITRRPEQPRAKKRGTGTTVDKAVTLLREHTGDGWHGVSKSHQEIGEEIRQLVGMSREQFCQVVLLPQGEFATFLRAGAAERAELLGRLFDTRRFRAVERRLRELRHEAEQGVGAGDADLRDLAARMRQAAGPAAPDLDLAAADDPGALLLAHAAVLRCDAREAHAVARSGTRAAESAHQDASDAADAARTLQALQRRHHEAAGRAEAIAAERPHRDAVRARLARANRALAVEPALALREKAATVHADALAEADALCRALARSGELPPAPPVPPARTPEPAPAKGAPAGLPGAMDDPVGGESSGAGGGVASGRGGAGVVRQGARGATGGERAAAGVELGGESAGGSLNSSAGQPGSRGGAAAAGGDGAAGGESSGAGDGPASGRGGAGVARLGDRGGVGADPWGADALGRRAGHLREELGALAGAEEAEAQAAAVRSRLAGLEAEERADEAAAREAAAWLERWPAERARMQQRVDAGAEAATEAAELAGQVATARARAEAAARRDALADRLARAEEAARTARDQAADARERWQDVREERIAGIAAELAADLVDGQPCRVCGAEGHPAPARPAERQVTRADEDAAARAHQQAQAGYEQAQREAARLAAEHAAATAEAGTAPRAELDAAYEGVAARRRAAARAAADLHEARAALDRAEAERDRRADQHREAVGRCAAHVSLREELEEQWRRLEGELARARGGHATVRERRARLGERIALLERGAHALRERQGAADRLAEARQAAERAAAAAGFDSSEQAEAALLPAEELWRAQRQAEAWTREEAAIEAALAEEEPAAAVRRPPADPAAAQAAADAAQRRLREASAAESAAAARSRDLDRLGRQAEALVRRLGPARAEAARLRRLSDLVSANSAENRYRMELETYVLAARLEQVAAAAGARLQRMSGGRYTLVHTDARTGGRGKSGLGLMVVDAWTGTERDTATLSGGETFFASLALALGLADVVTDEAGGARLDTLFIDEGFGSLDDQTLDEVLDVLDTLRERDRAVGIVSHVTDLRHRIPAQLRVSKGRDGSAIRLHTGAAG
jgi:exonuclease SbcC